MRTHFRHGLAAISCAAALALALSGCTTTSPSQSSTGPQAASGSGAQKSGATQPTGPAVLGPRTIGILNVNASDPAAAQLEDAAKEAITTLQWKSVTVDAGGNPSKMAAGMQQLLVQNVDAILLDAVDPAAVTQGLQQAKTKNVPVIVYGGQGTPSDLVSASIAPDDFTLASMVANYLTNAVGNTGNVAILATDALTFSRNRTTLLQADLASYPGIKVVETHQVDYANYVSDVQTAVAALLKQYPDLNAIITTVSPYSTPVISELQREGRKVAVIGFYDTPSNLDLIRSGGLTAVAATSFPQNAYQAVDALAANFGRGAPISGASQYALPLRYSLVNATNIDSTSTTAAGAVDYKSFYLKLWKSEFSNVA
jgi:ribose transport system substrate-binding protein